MTKYILLLFAALMFAKKSEATTCAAATVLTTLPFSGPITCSGANDINSGNSPTCGNPTYLGGNEAVFRYTPSANQAGITIAYNGVIWSGIFLYQGCPNGGGTCLQSLVSNTNAKTFIYGGTLTAGVTYYIVIDTWPNPASPCPGTVNISVPGNSICANQTPICSGTPINFTANSGGGTATGANPGNNYGCLGTTPNPSWFYLRIATAGNLIVDISAGSDVDYAIWGPYTSLATAQSSCGSYPAPTGCSYSTSATEQVNLPGVLANQVYVLLVTNFANTVQNITVNNAGGSATTDCSIVPLPVGLSLWDLYVAKEAVVLEWKTETEHNNSHFMVERSGDGKIWETIGIKQGAGNSQVSRSYNFRDEKPLVGISYYRLRQVDTDGKFTFTSVLSANTLETNKLKVYPNPSNGEFFIVADKEDVTNLYIADLSGKMFNPEVTNSGNTLKINTSALKKGMYQLIMNLGEQRVVTSIAVN